MPVDALLCIDLDATFDIDDEICRYPGEQQARVGPARAPSDPGVPWRRILDIEVAARFRFSSTVA